MDDEYTSIFTTHRKDTTSEQGTPVPAARQNLWGALQKHRCLGPPRRHDLIDLIVLGCSLGIHIFEKLPR